MRCRAFGALDRLVTARKCIVYAVTEISLPRKKEQRKDTVGDSPLRRDSRGNDAFQPRVASRVVFHARVRAGSRSSSKSRRSKCYRISNLRCRCPLIARASPVSFPFADNNGVSLFRRGSNGGDAREEIDRSVHGREKKGLIRRVLLRCYVRLTFRRVRS